VNTFSDDGTHQKVANLRKVIDLIDQASKTFGKSMQTVSTWKEKMKEAGFKNVQEVVYKVCKNPSPFVTIP
jgi:transposase